MVRRPEVSAVAVAAAVERLQDLEVVVDTVSEVVEVVEDQRGMKVRFADHLGEVVPRSTEVLGEEAVHTRVEVEDRRYRLIRTDCPLALL